MSQEDPSRLGRRATDRTGGAESARAPAIVAAQPARRPSPPKSDPAFDAQMLTQGSVKRGLRGGKEVLDAARTTYLKTEWSGPSDRRPPEGLFTKTKV
jgi:hypothetical protein